jgi:excisionase family DNA binding protein
MTEPEILTIKEAAMVLRCSKAHVSKLLAGKVAGLCPLPYIPLGRRKLIRSSALQQWMAKAEVTRRDTMQAMSGFIAPNAGKGNLNASKTISEPRSEAAKNWPLVEMGGAVSGPRSRGENRDPRQVLGNVQG